MANIKKKALALLIWSEMSFLYNKALRQHKNINFISLKSKSVKGVIFLALKLCKIEYFVASKKIFSRALI